jgi:hypothetical protein
LVRCLAPRADPIVRSLILYRSSFGAMLAGSGATVSLSLWRSNHRREPLSSTSGSPRLARTQWNPHVEPLPKDDSLDLLTRTNSVSTSGTGIVVWRDVSFPVISILKGCPGASYADYLTGLRISLSAWEAPKARGSHKGFWSDSLVTGYLSGPLGTVMDR